MHVDSRSVIEADFLMSGLKCNGDVQGTLQSGYVICTVSKVAVQQQTLLGPPGVLGIWGEGLFIFRELGSTANYFRGAGEQAYTFGDLGSTAKK